MSRLTRTSRIAAIALCFLLVSAPVCRAAEPDRGKALNAWCLDLTNAPADPAAGNHPVKVALIDSGARADNPYLRQGAVLPGYNYVFESAVTNDLIGHGTRAAGIIVGAEAGDRRLIGLGKSASIVPLVVTTKYASGVVARGDAASLTRAIRDAVDTYGCDIINLSIGIGTDPEELRAAVAHAEERGVIVVAAVGNANASAPDEVFYPAAYPTVVGVGSVGEDTVIAESSQRSGSVMIVAPGERVYALAADPAAEFEQVSGTSYASAYVTGFAALLRSHDPDLTPAEFRQLLRDTARDLGPAGYDRAYGYGLIDVARGLAVCLGQPVGFTDVTGWYAGYVNDMAASGIITGRSATRFEPLGSITRAEFAAILARISGDRLQAGVSDFADVDAADWFAPYVNWAAVAGVVTGDSGRFRPNEAIRRQDMAVMLARFAESRLGAPLPGSEATFADQDQIADYARLPAGKLQAVGILSGDEANRFNPQGSLRRCEAAKVAALLLQMLEAS